MTGRSVRSSSTRANSSAKVALPAAEQPSIATRTGCGRTTPRTTRANSLQSHAELSGADFAILVALTDAPGGRQRFQELAKTIDWEQSRLSHQIARMTRRGLVAREECPEDGRGAFVVATPTGRITIEAAAPHHVATIRRLVIDPLGPDGLATLARISSRILEQLDKAVP
jgi:DNA-binding MarR family transcriptional regulator